MSASFSLPSKQEPVNYSTDSKQRGHIFLMIKALGHWTTEGLQGKTSAGESSQTEFSQLFCNRREGGNCQFFADGALTQATVKVLRSSSVEVRSEVLS